MNCKHQAHCNLCPLMNVFEYENQVQNKVIMLVNSINKIINIKSIMYHEFKGLKHRHRADLSYQNDALGYKSLADSSVFELQECPQMSDELFEAYLKIKPFKFNIKKGSVRIRANILSNKTKIHGLWLDFSNIDIKNLFDEKQTLISLSEKFNHIEIGQRRKSLDVSVDKLKLASPTLHAWIKTYYQGQAIDLYSTIGGFTQSGNKAQLILSKIVCDQLNSLNAKSIFEFGSGIGTLTLGMISNNRKIIAAENDPLALLGLEKNLKLYDKDSQVEIIYQDLYRKNNFLELNEKFNFDTIVVNPPRSGLMSFVDLLNKKNINNIIYVSCSIESFKKDFDQLFQLGFNPVHAEIVDQFAYSNHFESVVTLTKQ